MKFPQIGEVLPNGHTVDVAYCAGFDRYVLAHKDGRFQSYVIWDVDQDGDTRNGRYFSELKEARACLATLISDTEGGSTIQDNPKLDTNPVSLKENYAERLLTTLRSINQRNREHEQEIALAVLTPEIEQAISNIPDVSSLRRFIYLWYRERKEHVDFAEMVGVLRVMYEDFRKWFSVL